MVVLFCLSVPVDDESKKIGTSGGDEETGCLKTLVRPGWRDAWPQMPSFWYPFANDGITPVRSTDAALRIPRKRETGEGRGLVVNDGLEMRLLMLTVRKFVRVEDEQFER